MDKLFLSLLNRSASAGWLILAVMALRLFMKRAPRWLTCALWGMAAVRLVCPFFPESPFSLIPSSQLLSPYAVQYSPAPAVTTGIPAVNALVNPVFTESFSPAPGASINPLHVWISCAGILWSAGFVVLLLYGFLSFLRIRETVKEAIPLRDNVWLCDHVSTPFILGVFRPRIYLPSAIGDQERSYVLAHEKAHLKRRDHWWKFLGYLMLSLYWFHPLIWASYVLFCRDMELACDEKVVKDMDLEDKKAYSHALVSLSLRRRPVSACPLAFGESSIKERVRMVLSYQKPAVWTMGAAAAVCVAAAVCFLTNPAESGTKISPDSPLPAPELFQDGSDLSAIPDAGPEALESPAGKSQENAVKELPRSALDQAIYNVIMERYQNSYSDRFDLACCDFVMLEKTSGAPDKNSPTSLTVTCYGWTFYQQYLVSEDGLESVGGCHVPTVLTFQTDYSLYLLKEYWEPKGGGDFEPDIRQKFPAHLVSDAMDSQKFITRQQQSCYRQAVQASGLDAEAVVDRLLEELCSGAGASFDPQTIPGQQNAEYRELIKYGEYTLTRFLDRFARGGEPEPKGKIMALICEELLGTRDAIPLNAADADSGQLWYETLLAHGPNRIKP